MFKSMTAYVYKIFALTHGVLTIEIHSVNRKYLEVSTNLSRELAQLDNAIKKAAAEKVGRGNLVITMVLTLDNQSPVQVKPNLPLARNIADAWSAIADHLGISEERGFSLEFLKSEKGILNYENNLVQDQTLCDEILSSLDQALMELLSMKKEEGSAVFSDIEARIEKVNEWIDAIECKGNDATDRYRQKLKERLEEVLSGSIDHEERILREVCLYADKIDISEELNRLRSHLSQFDKLMRGKDLISGKKLDFLIQEMMREANTIGAKTSDIDVSHSVVDIKGELEKVREQLQNIE